MVQRTRIIRIKYTVRENIGRGSPGPVNLTGEKRRVYVTPDESLTGETIQSKNTYTQGVNNVRHDSYKIS